MRIIDARLALACLLAAAPAPAQHAGARTPDAVIHDVLAASERPVDACIADLAGAGKSVIPGLVDVLAAGEADTRRETIVLGALERFPRGELSRGIERLLAPKAPPEARRDGYRLLGSLGTRQDLSKLCATLRRPDPDEDPDREEAGWFRAAVARILLRDALGYPLVREFLHREAAPIRYYLVGALSATQSAAALEILSAELRSRPAENLWLLAECSKIAAVVELPVDDAIPASIRVHLRSDDAMEVRSAVECLGRIEDFDSVSDLTGLLDHAHPDVQRTAVDALRSITGASFLADRERWRSWLRAESDWFAESQQRLADDLAGTDPIRKMAAIRELAEHPFYRREAARLLSRALPHESDTLVRAGCAALRQLRASSALPFLETCAESPSKSVADEARAAIEAIRAGRPHSAQPHDAQ
jgi:hypothetical protein